MLRFVTPTCSALLVTMATGFSPASAEDRRPQLQIINATDLPLQVTWLANDGRKVENGSVPRQSELILNTTIGHQFLVQSSDREQGSEVISKVPIQAYRYQGPGRVDVSDFGKRTKDGAVVAVTNEMNLPSFYTKLAFANGYPIVASDRVNDYAILEAAFLVKIMLAQRPDVLEAMIASGSRLCILSEDEFTTDLPELAALANNPQIDGIAGRDFWDARARGMGGSATDPYCSCGEENLLGFEGDPYATENILIHEFAHNIHLRGMNNVDSTFDSRLEKTYQSAMASGLWRGKYPSVNRDEYFAEGVQSWFDNNREPDHDHNHVNTRAELVEYDPGLATLCLEVFGDTELKYTKPATRIRDHLVGFDPTTSPKFSWPPRLDNAQKAIRKSAEERNEKAN